MSATLPLSVIRTDGGTQARAKLLGEVVDAYAESMTAGDVFEPVVVFHDGATHWLADGFHRVAAYKKAGIANAPCDVRQGTRRDAALFSVGANARHGQPRTNADKRRAVEMLLRDVEWSRWSDHEIARRASVSQPFVSKLRGGLSSDNRYQIDGPNPGASPSEVTETRKVSRSGTTYEQVVGDRKRRANAMSEPEPERPKTRRRARSPLDEIPALRGVRSHTKEARLAWSDLAAQWESDRRFDMLFAAKAGKAILTAFAEVDRILDEMIAACERHDAA